MLASLELHTLLALIDAATLRLFPGITAATVRAFLSPPVQGVVLETFGAGNAPQRADLVDALKAACERGVIIVAISQCAKGSVSDAYETGRTLQAAGIASGGDMTTEVSIYYDLQRTLRHEIVCSFKTRIPFIKTGAVVYVASPRSHVNPITRRVDTTNEPHCPGTQFFLRRR